MPLDNIIQGMQGIQALRLGNLRERQINEQMSKDNIASDAIRRYQTSLQSGSPDQAALNDAVINSPEIAKNVLESIGITEKIQGQDAASFALAANSAIDNKDKFLNLLHNRVQYLTNAGRDPSDTLALGEQYASGDIEGVKNDLKTVAAALANRGFLDKDIYGAAFGGVSGKVQSSNILDDGTVVQVLSNGQTRVMSPSGQLLTGDARERAIRNAQEYGAAIQAARAGGRQQAISNVDLSMRPEIALAETTAKTNAQGNTERAQKFIDDGISAAQSIPNIQRSLQLLDSVKTGGINNAMLGAKQYFGVAGADEGELSYNLGKTVVSQLRNTFGAAFTEKDREALEKLEAGFSKSPEVNKRLLKQIENFAKVKVKAGITAAQRAGDTYSEEQINSYLNQELTPQGGSGEGAMMPGINSKTQQRKLIYNPSTGKIE